MIQTAAYWCWWPILSQWRPNAWNKPNWIIPNYSGSSQVNQTELNQTVINQSWNEFNIIEYFPVDTCELMVCSADVMQTVHTTWKLVQMVFFQVTKSLDTSFQANWTVYMTWEEGNYQFTNHAKWSSELPVSYLPWAWHQLNTALS